VKVGRCNQSGTVRDMTNMGEAATRVGVALIVAAAGVAATHATSNAEPAAHQVRYTVSAGDSLQAKIYYLTTEPASQAAYDADSSKYLTFVQVPIAPDTPWVMETTLSSPNQWAIVTASGVLRTNPQFHCEIAVDGQTVVSQDGGSGVSCALRPW
jgi:hypothetical protein